MRYQELIEAKQLGRAFNHLEDLVFFYGSEGAQEAVQHLEDFASDSGSQSIRMKWDGNPQIYWGREVAGGPLILGGHNGWAKGEKTDSPEAIEDFILNKSGNPKTAEEIQARKKFAQKFGSLYNDFDRATPQDFVGFVYADGLFLDKPKLENGVYTFCPNPKSQTCYHVKETSDLGRRISNANIMVVGHAFFPEWGMPDASQEPMQDFSSFDNNPNLIVLGPVYNQNKVEINTSALQKISDYAQKTKSQVDEFLAGMPGLSDLKNIIYTYVNQTAKSKQLNNLGSNHFFTWLETSRVSNPKREKIKQLQQNTKGLDHVFALVSMIQKAKDNVIDQVEGEQGDIWDTNGEGRVRYADPNKKFGNVKLVPRKRWTPA
jgi:hypothetical protein